MNSAHILASSILATHGSRKRRSCDDDEEGGGLGLEELLGGAALNPFAISNQNYRENRYLLLTGPVTNAMFNEFRQAIIELNGDSDTAPIYLEIDTPGGDSFAMIGIMNMILTSKAPVDTYCQSKAHSAGAWIYLAGRRRFAPEGGLVSFLFHPARWTMSGVQGEYEAMTGAMRKMADVLSTRYAARTSLTADMIKGFTTMDEAYLMGEELFELGICTDLVTVNDFVGRYAIIKADAKKAIEDQLQKEIAESIEHTKAAPKKRKAVKKVDEVPSVDC